MQTGNYRNFGRAVIILLWLACAIPGARAAAAWQTNRLESITIGGNTFSNVTVVEVTVGSVTISHTRGLASFNPDKLLRADKEQLGLIEKAPAPPPETQRSRRDAGSNAVSLSDSNAMSFPAQLESLTPESWRKFLDELPPFQPTMLVGPIVVYLFVCFCFLQICRKAGKPSPLLVWIPILQVLPLLRAAQMAPLWFGLLIVQVSLPIVLFFVTPPGGMSPQMLMIAGIVGIALAVLQLIGGIIWSFKICKARGKSPVLGVFMLLPCTNVLALAYLAFSE